MLNTVEYSGLINIHCMTVFVDSINIVVNEETESCGEWSYLYIYIQTSYFVVTLKS